MLRALPLSLIPKQRFKASVRVTVECPPAFLLHGIKRYFEARHNVLDITIPMEPCVDNMAVTQRVAVEYEARVRRPLFRRRKDRFVFGWRTKGAKRPIFVGRLTVIPAAAIAELLLEGVYLPPFDELERMIRTKFSQGAAEAICQKLLETLKLAIETEFRMYEDLRDSRPDELYPTPTVGWKS